MSKNVLVVDDSATIRKFVAAALQLKGYRAITAADGMEALEKMPAQVIDVIITDLNMPDMDGYELIRTIRESPQYRDIPILVLSSMTDTQHKNDALELGVQAYLEKPLSVEAIQLEVDRCLGALSRP
jgi:CheY-like chemotaxis protein